MVLMCVCLQYIYCTVTSMVLCSCRLLGENQVMTLKFDDRLNCITIYLALQDDKCILGSKITSSDPEIRPLLQLFSMSLLQLYNYLSSQQCQLELTQDEGSVTIKYERIQNIMQFACLHTPMMSHLQKLPKQVFAALQSKQHIVEGIYESHLFLKNEKNIGEVAGHPGWFYNKRKDILQRVGRVDPFRKEDWDIKTYKFNVNLNRHHSEGPNQQKNIYALTFGLVHPNDYDGLEGNLDKYLCKTISVKVEGRKVYSHCMGQKQWLEFNESVQPQNIQIYVIRENKEGRLRTRQIEMYLNYHKRINLFTEEVLDTFEKELERFNDFVIFIYFKRTFLHFNFTANDI